ncbi:MAG: chromate efflux transporter [Phycisphaerae bacterium]
MPSHENDSPRPTLAEATRFWLKLGLISFGGPTGQIAIMHTELVEKRRWISESHFLHALNYCMLLPGPEAQQLATYIGWRLHRTLGGIIAGSLFVLPSALLLWILSYIYLAHGSVGWIADIFAGLKPAVLGIIAAAVLRIGSKALKNAAMWSIAGAAFVALLAGAPFPLIMLLAATIGYFGGKRKPQWFNVIKPHGAPTAIDLAQPHATPTLARAASVIAICGTLWWLPVLAAYLALGGDHAITRMGVFFSKAAMVTFGGAYAVLPFVAQQAVQTHGWIEPQQMLDGLALAETTPGPLIMVLQFVGFVGAWNQPGDALSPLVSATLGAAMTTWVTFLPCFLWIFLGAPYVDRVAASRGLTAALSAITAAVVGVVLKLAVWLATHILIVGGTVDVFAALLTLASFVAIARYKVDILWIVPAAAAIGLLHGALT